VILLRCEEGDALRRDRRNGDDHARARARSPRVMASR
jgi:hypothetical protein